MTPPKKASNTASPLKTTFPLFLGETNFMTDLDDKELRQGLTEIVERIEMTGYDDKTPEEKLEELNHVLKSGDDIVYVLDQAIERLQELEEE